MAFRLGGGRSILLSYGRIHTAHYTTTAAFVQAKIPPGGESSARGAVCFFCRVASFTFGEKYSGNPAEKHSKCRISIAILQEPLYNNFVTG